MFAKTVYLFQDKTHYPALSVIIRHYPALSVTIRHYPALSGNRYSKKQ